MSNQVRPSDPEKSDPENELRHLINQFDEQLVQSTVQQEVFRRIATFCEGVRDYQQHERYARPDDPPVLAQFGAARLLDYGSKTQSECGAPALIIPSLINRAYVLDLTEKRSLVRALSQRGVRPLLVDWGTPGDQEATYDLQAYITGPLQHFLNVTCEVSDQKPSITGYCMGGLLALSLAIRNPDRSSSLALLATPWDFHNGLGANLITLRALRPGLEVLLDQFGNLPVDVLQAMFASLDPALTELKFRSFAERDKNKERAQLFVALEDWVNDGVPLVAPVARECLFDWYLENAPMQGNWTIDGVVVSPDALPCPSLTVIPRNDHIVPPGSAEALADRLPNNERLNINAGHIGMVTGRYAKSALYEPLAKWIKSNQKG